jgi:hypothetical protein
MHCGHGGDEHPPEVIISQLTVELERLKKDRAQLCSINFINEKTPVQKVVRGKAARRVKLFTLLNFASTVVHRPYLFRGFYQHECAKQRKVQCIYVLGIACAPNNALSHQQPWMSPCIPWVATSGRPAWPIYFVSPSTRQEKICSQWCSMRWTLQISRGVATAQIL